jgi:cellulose synthase/poly-beta-1,6-N-acetylglucosamine synthase-like glycosyltransferase
MHSISLNPRDLWDVVVALGTLVSAFLSIRTVYIVLNTPSLDAKHTTYFRRRCVTVLLPIRNEATRVLRENLNSLLMQKGAAVDVVAVNDESTDNTADVLDDARMRFGRRLVVVDGTSRPAGWMGKTWALEQAKRESCASILVSADADVIYEPTIVARAVALFEQEKLDALSVLPRIEMVGLWEAIVIPAMIWLGVMRVSPTQTNRPASRAAFGHGNFIMFRRDAHDAIGGFAAYRADVLDDCAVMERLKAGGFRVRVVHGHRFLRSRMYASLAELCQGFGKNAFASLDFSIVRVVASMAVVGMGVGAPFVCVVAAMAGAMLPVRGVVLSAFSVVTFWLSICYCARRCGADARFLALYFVGLALSIGILVYSVLAHYWLHGLLWKGRRLADQARELKEMRATRRASRNPRDAAIAAVRCSRDSAAS